jgi:hypothetical protein
VAVVPASRETFRIIGLHSLVTEIPSADQWVILCRQLVGYDA